jgi:hypothetical protein
MIRDKEIRRIMVNVYVWAGMGQFGDGKYEIEKSVG